MRKRDNFLKTKELPFEKVKINDTFWNQRLKMNSEAILYQWDQLEKTRCIDNFRILAKEKQGFREGWFFSDSDYGDEIFDGSWIIRGKTVDGTDLIAIPYIFWANRGKSEMTVMVNI